MAKTLLMKTRLLMVVLALALTLSGGLGLGVENSHAMLPRDYEPYTEDPVNDGSKVCACDPRQPVFDR